MQVVSKSKRKIAIVLAVIAIAAATAGCLPDNQGVVAPADPHKAAIYNALNAHRRANGRPDLGYSPKLDLDGHLWAAWMGQNNVLQHQNLNGLLNKPEYGAFWTLGENISMGPWFISGEEVVQLFMNSTPHRNNILNRNFNVVGIGTSYVNGTLWVSLLFGGL